MCDQFHTVGSALKTLTLQCCDIC